MKTPRELLLGRHHELEPALDELRAETVQSLALHTNRNSRERGQSSDSFGRLLWQELFVACRRYWMGLGAAWCVIVGFAVVGGAEGSGQTVVAARPTGPVIQAMREQQAMRRELLGLEWNQQARAEPRDMIPGPRSEVAAGVANV